MVGSTILFHNETHLKSLWSDQLKIGDCNRNGVYSTRLQWKRRRYCAKSLPLLETTQMEQSSPYVVDSCPFAETCTLSSVARLPLAARTGCEFNANGKSSFRDNRLDHCNFWVDVAMEKNIRTHHLNVFRSTPNECSFTREESACVYIDNAHEDTGRKCTGGASDPLSIPNGNAAEQDRSHRDWALHLQSKWPICTVLPDSSTIHHHNTAELV